MMGQGAKGEVENLRKDSTLLLNENYVPTFTHPFPGSYGHFYIILRTNKDHPAPIAHISRNRHP